jgi:hypothetical protein
MISTATAPAANSAYAAVITFGVLTHDAVRKRVTDPCKQYADKQTEPVPTNSLQT